MIPKRKKRPRFNTRQTGRVGSQSHLQFVRGHECAVSHHPDHTCMGKSEAHHVRLGSDGALGVKPGDNFAVPLCSRAHREVHDMGEDTFNRRYNVNLLAVAERLWKTSPHRRKWEKDR